MSTFPTELLSSGGDGDMQAVIDAARESGKPFDLDASRIQGILVPQGSQVQIPDLSRWVDRPHRKSGLYHVDDVGSFISYFQHHQLEDSTVWIDPDAAVVRGVINDNGAGMAGWGDHAVHLVLKPTPEWLFWTRADGAMMTQTEFAEHIEEGLNEIVNPDAATMLEIAQSFQAHTAAAFRSSTRLQSGEQRLQYDETVNASAGSGDLLVPTEIELSIAPFVNEKPVSVLARFRFRIPSGRLSLGYKLIRPDAVVRKSIDDIAERLNNEFDLVYIGKPA